MRPALRKPLGGFLVVGFLVVYAALVGGVARWLNGLHVLVQAPLYLLLGIGWAPLLFPLARWIETGRFRAVRAPATPPAREV